MLQLIQFPRAAWLWLRVRHGWLQPKLLRLDRAFPLTVKVMLPIAVLAVIVAALVVWVQYRSLRGSLNEIYEERALLLAQTLQSRVSERPFQEYLDDPFDLQVHIERMLSMEPSLLQVSIYVRGEDEPWVIASSDPSLIGGVADEHDVLPLAINPIGTEETSLNGEKALEVLAPLTQHGLTVASVGLYVSLAERDALLWDMTQRIIIIPVVTVAAGVVLVWLTLELLVVRRLRRLAQAGGQLQAGELAARVPGTWDPPGRDEIARVINQFNRMANSLQDTTQRLRRQATRDSLTGLYNRRYFDQALPAEMERAQRLGYPLSLVMLDLDGFKMVNDRHGHSAGDDALRQTAALMRQDTRPMDTLVRYGGDEFVLILPGSDVEEASAVAERLRTLLAAARLSACDCCAVSASLGVAVYPRHAATADDLVKAADVALYAAKRGGSNLVAAAAETD